MIIHARRLGDQRRSVCSGIRSTDFTRSSSSFERLPATSLRDAPVPVDVIGTSDIVYGTLIALILAFTASFLQGRRNTNDFELGQSSYGSATSSTVAGENDSDGECDDGNDDPDAQSDSNANANATATRTTTTFDADSWKEMSRPESYVFYNRRLRERQSERSASSPFASENTLVVVALLALFVPIFSVEFFFALSRQLICGGDPMSMSDLSEFLCSPAATDLDATTPGRL